MRCKASVLIRSLSRWCLAALFTLTTASCTQAQPNSDSNGFTEVRYYRNNPDDVVTLKIPNGYIDYEVLGGLPRRDIESQMFFTAETATLNPRNKENNQSFEFPASLTQKIRFNILSGSEMPPGERHERMQKILTIPLGLPMRPCIRNLHPTMRFGLERYAIDPASCPQIGPRLRDDVLVERDNRGDIKTVIECMPDDVLDDGKHIRVDRIEHYSPHCQQSYELKELNSRVTIVYPREVNKGWKSLQQNISTLLMSFVQLKQ